MSYSENCTLGEIAYDGFHATSITYPKFETLSKVEQERWMQAARNACDARTMPGGLRTARWWRERIRDAHGSPSVDEEPVDEQP